ncbi:orotate phosphoribosyltransferase [Methanospirillum lacunae]|uniref:Orotate phosphoribosyltransferase n=1 Tax=Methanospirillum lacunae TaxID=668570 RepID=A0A2V2N1E9_9EURY|nr:orotate phosphoribosyltransferase [Methanospirillum lacunae]PWR74154.1 orotate phosphoribosyltransferase [Methanospirillum lacunae]
MVEKSLKDQLIQIGAIRFGNFTLASGKKSDVYIDIKMAMTHPEILKSIAVSVMDQKLEWDVVAGVAVGGVPLAVASSLESGRPYVIIRKEQKTHGLSSLIIGDVKGKRVVMIEDVTTSGGSALFGVDQIRQAGGVITDIISVVDRGEGAEETLSNAGIKLTSLVSKSDLVQK